MPEILKPKPPIYELFELIGQGSNGCVYRAVRWDAEGSIHQEVAIKVLNSKNLVEVWREEFTSLAHVRSEYCVRVFGFEWVQERPALVLEYIDGVSLSDLQRENDLSLEELNWLGQEIAKGLKELRAQGLCHGDLSPNNVMITKEGQVRLLDFGLGNFTKGLWRCTPRFAAPEVMEGCTPNYFSDLWSLGQLILQAGPASKRRPTWLKKLLHMVPERRRWDAVDLNTPESVIEKVNATRARIESRKGQTGEIPSTVRASERRKKIRAGWISSIMVFASCVSLTGAAAIGRGATPSENVSVRIRSNYGIMLDWDGRNIGYAPQDLARVPAGTHVIGWTRGGRRHQLTLTLRAGDHILIDDNIFKKP